MGGFETRPAKILSDQNVSRWASRIAESWQQSVQGIIATGKLIAEAKADLPHGRFIAMIESELPFSRSTAHKLMAIAADPKLSNVAHVRHLPASWGTLYEITKLTNEEFEAQVREGTIRAEMNRSDIGVELKRQRRAQRERELGRKQTALPQKKYGVIAADPEWEFEPWSRETGMDRAAANHYATSCLDVIKARDVPSIAADDCVLFLCATPPMLPHALVVMAAWGFTYKTNYVFEKDRIITGYWARFRHEHLLIGTRGHIPCPAPGQQWDSLIPAPVGKHSAKGDAWLEMIEQYFPTVPKIELNRRGAPRPGWDGWGNEAETDDAANAYAEPMPSVTADSASSPPAPPADDYLNIPDFLRIGHPACNWRNQRS